MADLERRLRRLEAASRHRGGRAICAGLIHAWGRARADGATYRAAEAAAARDVAAKLTPTEADFARSLARRLSALLDPNSWFGEDPPGGHGS